jgi:inosine/xanthosine triphosphate pyrophosphatase family protein
VPEGHSHSLAQLGPEVKNEISHRAKALRAFVEWLENHRS